MKPYTLDDRRPRPSPGGGRVTFTATFAVPSTAQQQLGSANLTLPAGFTLIAGSVTPATAGPVVGGVLQLRNFVVQPGRSRTVTVDANVPCVAVDAAWRVAAKQSNDFNGTGNDLTLVGATGSPTTLPPTSVAGACASALQFVTQPGDAAAGTDPLNGPFIPGVSVKVVDGAGNPVTEVPVTLSLPPGTGASLGGTTTVDTDPTGVAAFRNIMIATPGSYRLIASSPGLASVTSDLFTVDQVNIPCPTTGCSATAQAGQSAVKIDVLAGGQATGVLRLSYGLDGGTPIDCTNPDGSDYVELTHDEVTFDVTGDRAKVATYRIDKAAVAKVPNNGATFLQLCFGSPQKFPDRTGGFAADKGTFDWNRNGVIDQLEPHLFVGLLPDCPAKPTTPCVSKRQKNQAGDGIIESRLPATFPATRG